ncbi:MAG: hypothetical protein AAF530_24205 [Pseudomonadota bacterium]
MTIPPIDFATITFGRVVSVVIGVVVAASVFVGAWNALGLPRWAWAFELEELRQYSMETRDILLEDQLWNAVAKLNELEREREGYKVEGRLVPKSLSEEILMVRRRIASREKLIEKLGDED